MLKILLKKSLLQFSYGFLTDRKTGKRKGEPIVMARGCLVVLVLLSVGAMFFGISESLARFLLPDFPALYFSMAGILTTLVGVLGSVFSTYASLYMAKDNDRLLSLPIPPQTILQSRLLGVLFFSFLYTAVAWIPACLAAFRQPGYTVSGKTAVLPLLISLVFPIFVSVFTCFLGFLVAKLSKLGVGKTVLIIVLGVSFVALYYYCVFQMDKLLETIIQNRAAVSEAIHGWAYPLYLAGQGASGDTGSFFGFLFLSVVLGALCYLILSKTFLKLSISSEKQRTVGKRSAVRIRKASLERTLLRREWKRFCSCPVYVLNNGLGLAGLLLIGIYVTVRKNLIRDVMFIYVDEVPGLMEMLPVAVTGILCLLVATNTISTPSISLEGSRIWILQSLPIDPFCILQAKERLHVELNMVPAVLAGVLVGIVFEIPFDTVCLMLLFILVFIWFTAALGLIFGVCFPKLSWNNESEPVKQNLSVLGSLFTGWVLAAVMALPYYFAWKTISCTTYIFSWTLGLFVLTFLLERWLQENGSVRFSKL